MEISVSIWTMGTIASPSGHPHCGAGSSLQVKLTEQGPMEPEKAKGLSTPQPQERPWHGGGVVGRGQLERPCWGRGGLGGGTPGRDPGHPGDSAPGPALAARPAPPRSPPRFASKTLGALSSPPHFHSLPLRSLSLRLWFSCRRRPPVPWMPRSSRCWPSCWLRSASATVSALGAVG